MCPSLLRRLPHRIPRRPYTTKPPPPPSPSPSPTPTPPNPPPSKTRIRLNSLLDRTPRFLHPYTSALRTAPLSHILSFLILHELTAIIPLIGLSTAFHYSGGTPEWVRERGVEYEGIFRRWFGRRGWFGVESGEVGAEGEKIVGEGEVGGEGKLEGGEGKLEGGEGGGGVRIVMEVAAAYAVTKVLLPVRIIGSVWATPWFARVVVGRFKRFSGLAK